MGWGTWTHYEAGSTSWKHTRQRCKASALAHDNRSSTHQPDLIINRRGHSVEARTQLGELSSPPLKGVEAGRTTLRSILVGAPAHDLWKVLIR